MFNRIRAYLKGTWIRYMVSYLLLMALLVGGLTLYMYSYYRRSVYSSAIAQETSLAYQIKYMSDGYLDALGMLSSQVSALPEGDDEAVVNALAAFPARKGETLMVYLPKTGRLYTPKGSFDDDDQDAWPQYEDLRPQDVRAFFSAPSSLALLGAQNVTLGGEEARLLTLITPIPGKGSVVSLLAENELLTAGTSGSGLSANRYIIAGGEICARGESFTLDDAYVLRAGGYISDVYTDVRRIGGRQYLFVAVPGSENGVVYVSVLTLTGIYARAAGVWLGFVAVLMLIAVPCMGFMAYISRRNLAPIREMGRRFGAQEDVDELGAITRGIDALEDRNRAMEQSTLEARRKSFARELLSGVCPDRQSAMEAASAIGLSVAGEYFAVILAGLDREGKADGLEEEAALLAPEGVNCVWTRMEQSDQRLALVFAPDASSPAAFAGSLCRLDSVRAWRLPVAMSAVHTDWNELSTAYLEATSAYESRFFMGDGRLLRFDEIPFSQDQTLPASADYAGRIGEALENGDRAGVDAALTELGTYLRSRDMNLFAFRRAYNDVIGAIMSRAIGAGYSHADVYDLFSLSGCRSAEELEDVLRNVCLKVIDAKQSMPSEPGLENVARIMAENYTDPDFSVGRAAALANISPARLSLEFKSRMGVTAADYLASLRMEEARRLLRQTNLPVSEVCRQSGYADASAFTRRFKRYADMTPLQYRQAARSAKAPEEATSEDRSDTN